MFRRLSLRGRLVLGVIVLALVGLGAADIATYASLRGFLLNRTDASLRDESFGVARSLHEGCGSDEGRPLPGTSPGDFIELRSAGGAVLCKTQAAGFSGEDVSQPRLPARIDLSHSEGPDRVRYLTVPAQSGHGRYRVRTAAEPGLAGGVVLVATSLADVDATLRRLLLIELLVTGVVLAALAALGLWVVRLGLRPLRAIEQTAAAIAGGELSHRIERAEPRTEVGRLGMALNAMLGQIETAFRAREASERKLRRFVSDASHELRTPLTAVRAYSELFGRGADQRPGDLARAMSGITRESERMSLLVDDLLLLARLDEGRPLAREAVELETVVREAVETAAAVEPDRPLAFDVEPAVVLGDRERLRQIVDNLLANIRAHTPFGAPASVSVRREGDVAVVEVSDSGPGLSAEEAERVFERFYRVDPSRARASGGVGLGLSIVSAVVAAHGGTVSAASQPGEGTTFRIELPLAQAPDALEGQGEERDHGAGEDREQLRGDRERDRASR